MQHEQQGSIPVDEYVSWVLAAIGTAIATLAAAVATLWKVNESRNSKQIEELKADVKDCKEDRERIRARCDEQSDELAAMKMRLAFLELEEKQRNGDHD